MKLKYWSNKQYIITYQRVGGNIVDERKRIVFMLETNAIARFFADGKIDFKASS